MMRISDRTLNRWLRTGRPRRVEVRLQDPEISDRLDAMTRLTGHESDVLAAVVAPPSGLNERLVERVSRRVDDETIATMIDLYGLAWYTASALFDADGHRPEEEI